MKPLPVGSIVGGRLRVAPGDTARSEHALPGRLWGEPPPGGRPNACQAVGSSEGLRYMLPPGRVAGVGFVNGELGFYSGEGA